MCCCVLGVVGGVCAGLVGPGSGWAGVWHVVGCVVLRGRRWSAVGGGVVATASVAGSRRCWLAVFLRCALLHQLVSFSDIACCFEVLQPGCCCCPR